VERRSTRQFRRATHAWFAAIRERDERPGAAVASVVVVVLASCDSVQDRFVDLNRVVSAM